MISHLSKNCKKCLSSKNLSEFRICTDLKDGYRNTCKTCENARAAIRRALTPVYERQMRKNWKTNNKDKVKLSNQKYSTKHPDKIAESNRKWQLNNKDKVNANTAKYYASKISACPNWLTAKHLEEMVSVYTQSAAITKTTGIKHEVDHIIPLNGKTVCGLHVPWNLQILTKTENVKKSNK